MRCLALPSIHGPVIFLQKFSKSSLIDFYIPLESKRYRPDVSVTLFLIFDQEMLRFCYLVTNGKYRGRAIN